jgi:hypothetical protein
VFKGKDARLDIFNLMKTKPEARRLVRELLTEYFNWDLIDGIPNIPKDASDTARVNCIIDFFNDLAYNNPEVFQQFLKEKPNGTDF